MPSNIFISALTYRIFLQNIFYLNARIKVCSRFQSYVYQDRAATDSNVVKACM